MPTIREALIERLKKGGSDRDIIKDVSKELQVQRSSVRAKLSRIRQADKAPAQTVGRSLAEFKQTYDKNTIIPQKVRAALKELGTAWEYEAEFIKRADISYTDLAAFRDMFSDHVVIVKRENKKIWCGTVAFANQLKELT
jgi:hypothetical protein